MPLNRVRQRLALAYAFAFVALAMMVSILAWPIIIFMKLDAIENRLAAIEAIAIMPVDAKAAS